ncbi:MAG: PAC2 family protein [Chloroflexi bacterium]|nr:PAC2 family protein [Chloroflexota bacterium]
MKIGAFELPDPVPELRTPHALIMIRPWVDVGSVGTLTLARLERHYEAKELGKLARPGTFFDLTRYRPTVRNVDGQRVTTFPNSIINVAQPENGPDLMFLHLLEPHAMAEDYIDSIVELLKYFQVSVYCRVGAMYDSVPHTRPIVVTGNTGSIEPRPGATPPLTQQRGSSYEGPTTIMNLLTESATQMGAGVMNFMAHLPHYAQLEEDFAGTARMLQVLNAYYDFPSTVVPTRRAERQYRELDSAIETQPEVKSVISRLEAHYDRTYETTAPSAEPPTGLSPEIERFLRGLDKEL